jgi:hypothetical protein
VITLNNRYCNSPVQAPLSSQEEVLETGKIGLYVLSSQVGAFFTSRQVRRVSFKDRRLSNLVWLDELRIS